VSPLRIPFFDELDRASTVLLAGAGGGFDIFSGLPLYFALRAQGKRVHLANLTYSKIHATNGDDALSPACVRVTADSAGRNPDYFPEKHLCQWLRDHGHGDVPVYTFCRTGARPITDAYQMLADELRFDTLIVVDGGTDSLLRGDEEHLGSPAEDAASIAAADALTGVPRRLLVCLGFGIDTFHGVCHAHVLEAIAEIARTGGYLGAFSLTRDMPEVRDYIDAVEYVNARTPGCQSIVSASIVSAIEGQFGDFHRTDRTRGHEQFINPLMAIYWCFHLEHVAGRIEYLPEIRRTHDLEEVKQRIDAYRATRESLRPWKDIPL
jgi:hypothetical protein